MEPDISPGDFLCICTLLRQARIDRLILVKHPRYGVIVKRVVSKRNDQIYLKSDHPDGLSSEAIGPLRSDQVIGRVVAVIRHRNTQRFSAAS